MATHIQAYPHKWQLLRIVLSRVFSIAKTPPPRKISAGITIPAIIHEMSISFLLRGHHVPNLQYSTRSPQLSRSHESVWEVASRRKNTPMKTDCSNNSTIIGNAKDFDIRRAFARHPASQPLAVLKLTLASPLVLATIPTYLCRSLIETLFCLLFWFS